MKLNFKSTLVIFILGTSVFCSAQNYSKPNFQYGYQLVCMDSSFDKLVDPALDAYLQKKRLQLSKKMDVVIGTCPQTMNSFAPQSPLSNFLTDMLLNSSALYQKDGAFTHLDLAVLNFGGIRTQISAGNVTVGNIYAVSPFDNYLVFIELKGIELKKIFARFNPQKDNAPFAGVKVRYENGSPIVTLPDGSPILDDYIYKMVTVDFIADGGDQIMSGVLFERKVLSDIALKDFIILEIQKMNKLGQPLVGVLDDRIILEK